MYTRIRSFSLLIATSLFLTACAAEPDAPGADEFFDDPDLAAAGKEDGSGVALSSVGLAVVDALNATAPGEYGRTWTISSTNRLDADWIVQSPPRAHWGAPAAAIAMPALCTSGSNCDLDFGLRTCAVDADCGATKADIRDGGGRVRSIAGPGRSV